MDKTSSVLYSNNISRRVAMPDITAPSNSTASSTRNVAQLLLHNSEQFYSRSRPAGK